MTIKSFIKTLERSKIVSESTVQSDKRPLRILVNKIHRSSQQKTKKKKIGLLRINYKSIVSLEKYVTKELISKKSTGMFLLNVMDTNEIHRRSIKF